MSDSKPSCQICGRGLSDPKSVAAGVGPICGNRGYTGRVQNRHGSSLGGWSNLGEWEVVNHPCYSCKAFCLPKKDDEKPVDGGFLVRYQERDQPEQIEFFGDNAIGGYCRKFEELVDGNQIGDNTACNGSLYTPRKTPDQMPKTGILVNRVASTESTLSLSHPELTYEQISP